MELKEAINPDVCALDAEAYARTVFHQRHCANLLRQATADMHIATAARQNAWALVQVHIDAGRIKPGIYRLRGGHALTIEREHRFPDVHPLYSI